MSHWGFVFLLQVHKIKVCVSLGVCFLVTGALDKGVCLIGGLFSCYRCIR